MDSYFTPDPDDSDIEVMHFFPKASTEAPKTPKKRSRRPPKRPLSPLSDSDDEVSVRLNASLNTSSGQDSAETSDNGSPIEPSAGTLTKSSTSRTSLKSPAKASKKVLGGSLPIRSAGPSPQSQHMYPIPLAALQGRRVTRSSASFERSVETTALESTTRSVIAKSKPPMGLFDLPPELVTMIIKYLFCHSEPIVLPAKSLALGLDGDHPSWDSNIRYLWDPTAERVNYRPILPVNFLATCRRAYDEGIKTLWQSNHFRVHQEEFSTLKECGYVALKRIRRLSVYVQPSNTMRPQGADICLDDTPLEAFRRLQHVDIHFIQLNDTEKFLERTHSVMFKAKCAGKFPRIEFVLRVVPNSFARRPAWFRKRQRPTVPAARNWLPSVPLIRFVADVELEIAEFIEEIQYEGWRMTRHFGLPDLSLPVGRNPATFTGPVMAHNAIQGFTFVTYHFKRIEDHLCHQQWPARKRRAVENTE